jgi:DNA repair exonuclease SbcCD ATPase subunit
VIYIKRLKLANFCNITSADLDFQHKIILLNGKSAQGKSTILDAIALCLTSKKRADKYSEYVKRGTDQASIWMEAEIYGKPISFDLRIKSGAWMQVIYENKTYINTEANELLNTFDFNYFADIILSMQGDEDVTKLSPTQRSNYLQKLLNFDFSEHIQKIQLEITGFKQNIQDLDALIFTEESLIINNLNQKKDLKTLRVPPKYLENLQEQLEQKKLDLDEAQKNSEDINKLNEQINDKQLELAKINKTISNSKDNLKSIETAAADYNKAETMTNELNDKLVNLVYEIDNITVQVPSIKDIINSEEKAIKKLEITLFEQKSKLVEINNVLKLLEEKRCPHCGQDTTQLATEELKKHIEHVPTDEAIKEAIDQLNNKINLSEEAISLKRISINTQIKSLTELQTNKDKLNKDVDTIKGELETYLKVMSDYIAINADPVTVTEYIKELKASIIEKESETKIIENSIRTLTHQKGNLNIGKEDISVLSNEVIDINTKINNYNTQKQLNDKIKKDNAELDIKIEQSKEKQAKYKEDKAKYIQSLSIRTEAMDLLAKHLPNYMVIKTCSSLQTDMNDFIQSVFPEYNVKLQNSKRGVDFTYTNNINLPETAKNKWTTSKMSSGMEKALLTIAFKVALAKSYGINFLVLDEIDSAADSESSEKLFEILLSEIGFTQIVIISHKTQLIETIQNLVDDTSIYKVELGKFKKIEGIE